MSKKYEESMYFANVVLGAIENVKTPMLVYEEEKEVVKKALEMYKDYLTTLKSMLIHADIDIDDYLSEKE